MQIWHDQSSQTDQTIRSYLLQSDAFVCSLNDSLGQDPTVLHRLFASIILFRHTFCFETHAFRSSNRRLSNMYDPTTNTECKLQPHVAHSDPQSAWETWRGNYCHRKGGRRHRGHRYR